MEYKLLRMQAGLSIKAAAKLFNRSPRTIRRWDRFWPPKHAILLFSFLNSDLSFHNKACLGFYFDGDVIITPTKKVPSTGDLLSYHDLVQTTQLSRFYDSVT